MRRSVAKPFPVVRVVTSKVRFDALTTHSGYVRQPSQKNMPAAQMFGSITKMS